MVEDELNPDERGPKDDPSKNFRKPYRYVNDESEISKSEQEHPCSVMKKGIVTSEDIMNHFESVACIGDTDRIESVLKKHELRNSTRK